MSIISFSGARAADGDVNEALMKKLEAMEQRIQSLEAELKQKQAPAAEKQAALADKPTPSSEKPPKKAPAPEFEKERRRRGTGGPSKGLPGQALAKVEADRCFVQSV